MPLHSLPEHELREHCRAAIESLEYWLRRLIDDVLTETYGNDYLTAKNEKGGYLIRKTIRENVEKRQSGEPGRFSRPIDAAMLNEAIDIVCHPNLYKTHFKAAFDSAFPDGREEARTFLYRLVQPRHNLAHANPISVRQAEQIVCYSHDVIDSLKSFYIQENMAQQYNVPMIVRITDSLGHVVHANQIKRNRTGAGIVNYQDDPDSILYPGARLSIEVEVDPSFTADEYEISWTHCNQDPVCRDCRHPKYVLDLEKKHVKNDFAIYCEVTSNKDWHRLGHRDDHVAIIYKVLPPP